MPPVTYRLGTILFVLCMCGVPLHQAVATNPQVRTIPPQEPVVFATPFKLIIEVAAADDTVVTFQPHGETLGPFDIIDTKTPALPRSLNNEQVWRKEFILETLQVGELLIPAIAVSTHDAAQETSQTLSSDPIDITVLGVIEKEAQEDPSKFRGLANLEPSPAYSKSNYLKPTLAALGLASLLILVGWYRRSRRQNSPTDWARQQLQELRQRGSQDALATWSDQFESTLRQWSKATGIDASGASTTSELVAHMRDQSKLPLNAIEEALRKAELNKFSGKEARNSKDSIGHAHREEAILEALELIRVSGGMEAA